MKKTKKLCSFIGLIIMLLMVPIMAMAQQKWPHPIPARVTDNGNKDLFIMTLGDISTPLSDGIFDPVKDEVILNNGTVIQHYYRDTLGVKFYHPMDKSIFPLPPSGLCTWYYYYQDINEKEVKINTDWVADHLKEYGARYIQIDDGWQVEKKDGKHGSRDWTGIDQAFPSGMADLASYIKSKGLVPGIWIAPHGQSNEAVVKKYPGAFLLKPDGTSASKTWEGDWLVDGSAKEGNDYLAELFRKMVDWGYEYFKIDGQPIVPEEYQKNKHLMKNPGEADEVYRKTLHTIRSVIGPNSYLLGCWGLPIEGAEIMNGTRTGGDVVLGWDGFFTALGPTMESYYQHNILWYTDPDVMLLRQPLTLEQARVWATLQGLTGQALMSSDRLVDLSDDRVELMRRVYPATDIRPLDLFPSKRNKRIWDLKINHLGRQYDVVGLFNFEQEKSEPIRLDWKELGLPEGVPVQVYDFWNNEYLGAWEAGMSLTIPPTSCRVLTLIPNADHIQLISTSRHITQGWVDLVSLTNHPDTHTINGTSHVIGQDPYQLAFAYPRGTYYKVKSVQLRSDRKIAIPYTVADHQGWSTVKFNSPESCDLTWTIVFEPADHYTYKTRDPGLATVTRVGLNGINLSWNPQYYLNAGYQVYLDGQLLGYTPDCRFPLRDLNPKKAYQAEVRTVWDDGTTSEKAVVTHPTPNQPSPEVRFTIADLLPETYPLIDLDPIQQQSFHFTRPLIFDGKKHNNTIIGWMNTATDYNIQGLFTHFTALAGVSNDTHESSANDTVEFIISGDGRELWKSGPMKKADAAKSIDIDVTGISILSLKTVGPQARGFGRRGVIAGWAEANLAR